VYNKDGYSIDSTCYYLLWFAPSAGRWMRWS
jgi:hypothetical protein